MRTIYIVKSTLPTIESARDLARILVEEKLAACVQIGARMESAYAWNGEIRIDEEYPISIKTSAAAMEKLEARFRELHPYECPSASSGRNFTLEKKGVIKNAPFFMFAKFRSL